MESTDSSRSFEQSQYSGEGTSASAATSTFSPSADSFLALLNEENPDIERLLSTDIGTPDLTVSNSPANSSLHGAEEFGDISIHTGLVPGGQGNQDHDNLSPSELSEEDFEIPGAVSRWMTAAQASGGNLTGQESFPENWEDVDNAIQEFRNDLKVSTGIGKVKREGKRGRTRKDPNLTPEIQRMLGEANLLYVEQKYTEAIGTLQEIIRLSPNVHKAWFTLGMIQEELGNEDKALQLYLVAAHLTLKDGALWKRLGLMSKKQGAVQQAIYCFSRAISADYHDVDAIWDRSFLYADSGQLRKAIEGYKSILQYVPYHMNVIRELTRIYIQINDLNSAITFFEEALSHYLQREATQSIHTPVTLNNAADIFGFDYSDLNIMVELYMMMGDFEKAIHSLKRGVRKLHGRDKEVWWDTVEDDREFDETPTSGIASVLPLELRAKLGECRLMLGQVNQAKIHFKYLFKNSIEKYADLYHEVAETYMEKRMFEEALAVYEEIINHEVTDGPIAWVQMAICHRELGNLDSAVELYTAAVEAIPEDLDNKIALAEIYEELGEEERALELVIEVDEARKAARTLASLSESKDQEPENIENSAINNFSIFNVESSRWEALKAKNAATRAARLQQEQEAERDTKIKFQKLGLLMSRLATDEKARNEYFDTAQCLFDDFRDTKAFYPSDRMKRFTGFRDRVKWATLDEQVKFMVARLKHSTAGDGSQFNTNPPRFGSQSNGINENEDEKTIPTSFRSFSFEEWFDMFVKYAITLASFGRQEEAYDLLKTVGEANVYYHHEPTKIAIKMIILAISLHCHNNEKACEVARWLCSYHPFHDNSYKMYSAAMSSGTSATSVYASANSQKYFLRQIKTMDFSVDNSRSSQPNNQSNIAPIEQTVEQKENTKDNLTINKRNPLLLTLYGHILHCARSYVPAIGYYTRAYTLSPDDPLISLSLGLAYIHRAMQRQTDNRHLQIMQVRLIDYDMLCLLLNFFSRNRFFIRDLLFSSNIISYVKEVKRQNTI
ncbi:transcription factor TFIIIC subunit tfc4, variant 4 [Basidiobolus ranarum]|uniref:Transcription factor TFIIIC subunit tfc4, variant 4 n=1 Tax=Basidiobolus ranarum TaxID=34480 RepID=A0ABR2X512_9FUNG